MNETKQAKLDALAALIQGQQLEAGKKQGLRDDLAMLHAKTLVFIGKKYARVDCGTSGWLMVDIETEEIFGIKGYGVVHKGHRFGTLDETAQWDWSGYCPVQLREAAGQPLEAK